MFGQCRWSSRNDGDGWKIVDTHGVFEDCYSLTWSQAERQATYRNTMPPADHDARVAALGVRRVNETD